MNDEADGGYELLAAASLVRFRILKVEGEERSDASWQRVSCHMHREDLPWGATALLFAIGVLSFADGRPRGVSDAYYRQKDDWTVDDMVRRLRFERGALVFDADYVRGRMMKTHVTVEPNGRLVIETRNRHEMALRWLGTLRGRKHLRLVVDKDEANG